MNTLTNLVSSGIKRQGISRGKLAAKTGHTNIDKELRRIDAFLLNPYKNSKFAALLPDAIGVSKEEFDRAIDDTRLALEAKERLAFKPHIQIRLDRRPSPIFVGAMIPGLTRIKISESLSDLPYAEEMKTVWELYENHREKYSPGWPAGNGYCYYRTYHEALCFDVIGNLIDGDQCQPYSFGWKI